MELTSPIYHAAEFALLAFIAVYYSLHIPAMMHHAHHKIHTLLKIEPGEKCGRWATFGVVAFMTLMACVACAPAVHAGIGALMLVLG